LNIRACEAACGQLLCEQDDELHYGLKVKDASGDSQSSLLLLGYIFDDGQHAPRFFQHFESDRVIVLGAAVPIVEPSYRVAFSHAKRENPAAGYLVMKRTTIGIIGRGEKTAYRTIAWEMETGNPMPLSDCLFVKRWGLAVKAADETLEVHCRYGDNRMAEA
jgi:hypothetical protein